MRTFFKMFFAALLALIVFCSVVFLLLTVVLSGYLVSEKPVIAERSVLYIDLSRNFPDRKRQNPLIAITGNIEDEVPSLYELLGMIRHARSDTSIRGIYIRSNSNGNGYASSQELRDALADFRASGKFVVAYGDYITQGAYLVSSVANRVYCHPKGMVDWSGFAVEYVYFKNLLKRLEIEPQIFYDGKFKSATEPFREDHMTDANRLQTQVWLGDIYNRFLTDVSRSRKLDTATLHRYANEYSVRTPADAERLGLIDGARYDDEVKDEIKKQLKLKADDKISFVMPGTYLHSFDLKEYGQDNKIAVVMAEGEIVDGRGEEGQIGSDEYRSIIRKIRYNKDVKAIVLRVNSPGGSSLASESIWRELSLAQKAGIHVVVSMGDVAASGGYYISCLADSIFVQPNTITGSIGVFAMIPNMESFFRNKLGVTFDRVKTATYADALTISKPLTASEKMIIQSEVDRIYGDFKTRVADGRKKDTAYIGSIAQGRVWTGERAISVGLADKVGGMDDAIRSAAALAHIRSYNVRVYPEPRSPLDLIFGSYADITRSKAMEEELGKENYRLYLRMKSLKDNIGTIQARLPFEWNMK